MPSIEALTALVAAVCPIHGISVGSWGDNLTWRIDFKAAATAAQRAAAAAAMAAFDPATDPTAERARIDREIEAIERRQHRAVREHAIGDAAALDRLRAIEDQIAALRAGRP